MKELGEYLRRTRISNGVSIAETAEDLDFSTSQIENIESGNVRAFKDVYDLKERIKQYAKYLGLDSDKVVDEFNGFLFEHTSRISLEDIRNAQNKLEEKETKRTKSPYTIEYKQRISLSLIMAIIVAILLLFLVVYLIVSSANKAPTQVDELMPSGGRESVYELTY